MTVSLAWLGGSCAARRSWKTAVCAQPAASVLLSCVMVLLRRKQARDGRPKPRPKPSQGADWPRPAGAWGSECHALALREASGEPAGRRLSRLGFDIVMLLVPVFPIRMCTGVPAQHGAPPPPPGEQCVCDGVGAMRRCEASRHSVGLRRQQPDAQPHVVCLPSCGVSFRGDLVSWVVLLLLGLLLLGLQLAARGWRTQQELPGVHAAPPATDAANVSSMASWGGRPYSGHAGTHRGSDRDTRQPTSLPRTASGDRRGRRCSNHLDKALRSSTQRR